MNTFASPSGIGKLIQDIDDESSTIDLARYYKKHLQSYTRWQLRQQLIANKKARKRELLVRSGVQDLDPVHDIEVSDVSDSEIRSVETTDGEEQFSPAEDLFEMFSDRRLDDDEKYFINQASTNLSLNDFVPTSELISREDIPNDYAYYENYEENIELPIEQLEEPPLEFVDELKIYTHSRNDWTKFPPPKILPDSNLLSYYLLDGASALAVVALNVQFGDVCADYCAAPGGKTLSMLMTLRPSYLLCNDISISRLSRLTTIMQQYAPDINYLKSTLQLTRKDASSFIQPDGYDKILVDVPCSNDRVSVDQIDNNIFKRSRTEERLSLPSVQSKILRSALKSLRLKGSLVYSTCTMSPVENDGVVQKALLSLQEEGHPYRYAIMNLKEAFRPLRGLYRFNTKFKYGQQILPHVTSNFGPMYICKIKRIS